MEAMFLVAALGAAGLLIFAVLRRVLGRGRKPGPELILDGSNVMHWREGGPSLDTVREAVDHLTAKGFTVGVIFDANAGYKLSGRYRDDDWFAAKLRLPGSRVVVVPRGTPADATILRAARDRGARIVTNDRFRDWADAHPEVTRPGHLVRGRYRAGRLQFDT
ncbi:NYN domain-containing protein [Jannaschia formosa]|uniref:NYN domain-containing protein n=1 Tax=Jannaschia formosa TaxID=2259592 RepID=UPI000E1BA033|nr:hypothetical protein [Jannaschia formosa]TFL16480.1 hypothetical protein DR046_19820 [Jannaschia formosa]